MSANTSIEWTDRSWNPVRGCALVSEGCRNCYAMRVAHRFAGPGGPYEGLTDLGPAGPRWSGKIRTLDEALVEPLHWRKPQRIFVNSMSDLFHEGVEAEFVARVFAVMALARRHTFQVLTKRPERMRTILNDPEFRAEVDVWITMMLEDEERPPALAWDAEARLTTDARATAPDVESDEGWPLPNVWLGTSVENRPALHRLDALAQTPAAVRFASFEPLLEDLGSLSRWLTRYGPGYTRVAGDDALAGFTGVPLSWTICGGESGPSARPCALEWIEGIVEQCRAASVPVFVKQLGAFVVSEEPACDTDEEAMREFGFKSRWLWRAGLKDRKGGDPEEWPEELRVRQFPETQREAVRA